MVAIVAWPRPPHAIAFRTESAEMRHARERIMIVVRKVYTFRENLEVATS